VYRGANLLTVDPKGRVAMPARYRQSLLETSGGQMVITANFERCLLLYPLPTWLEIERKLLALPDVHAQSAGLKRLLVGHATEVEMDKQGRLLLPPVLRDYAQLSREVMLVGRINGFELWDEAAWNAQRDQFLATTRDGNFQLPDGFGGLTL
jgi:MraZ protein